MLVEDIEGLIAGRVVMMTPGGAGHNTISHNLYLLIDNCCRMFGETYVFPADDNHFIP